jgi:hypothetical protein
MDSIPIQVILIPLLGIVIVVYFMMMRKRTIANNDQQYPNYRASELARRLGLTLVSGDPNFNLFIIHTNSQVLSGPTDKTAIDVNVKMQGCPKGVNLELIYLYHVTQETGYDVIKRHITFDCRMVAYGRQSFPPFEVVSRTSSMGAIQQTMPIAPIATGNPAVDAAYLVATAEPRLAQLLGTHLPQFGQFLENGVHLVGDGQSISFVMKQDKPPLLANALYYAETMAENLGQMAKAIGG